MEPIANSPPKRNQSTRSLSNSVLVGNCLAHRPWKAEILGIEYIVRVTLIKGTLQGEQTPSMERGLLVLYGTQTGTAREYAERIAQEAFLRRIPYGIESLLHFTPERLASYCTTHVLLFIVSTTGDGETPTAMQSFWQSLLRKDLSPTCLGELKCAIMGLGDSSYEKFCFVGKRLYRRLEQLGVEFIGLGRADADEQHPLGLDGAFLPWIESIWDYMSQAFNYSAVRLFSLSAKVSLESVSQDDVKDINVPLDMNPNLAMCLLENRRITPNNHFQDVRHLIFQSVDRLPEYRPGDVAIVMPFNPLHAVDELLTQLGWQDSADIPFWVRPRRLEVKVPSKPVTLRALLERYLDINAPPRRTFFAILSRHVDPNDPVREMHREKLEEIESPQGLDLYLDYVWKPRRTPLEVLCDFPLCIPPEFIFDLFPLLRPREFSISSAFVQDPHQVHITAALVSYKTSLSCLRVGVCSRWIETLVPNTPLRIDIRKGSWVLSDVDREPLLLIAAGTGIAPMRAVIQHVAQTNPSRPMYLLFGCRNVSKDFHFHDEWIHYPNLTVHALGSRDQAGVRRHIDVLVRQQANLVRTLILDMNASILVAGNSKLPGLVKKTLVEICDDPQLLQRLQKANRLQIEAWS